MTVKNNSFENGFGTNTQKVNIVKNLGLNSNFTSECICIFSCHFWRTVYEYWILLMHFLYGLTTSICLYTGYIYIISWHVTLKILLFYNCFASQYLRSQNDERGVAAAQALPVYHLLGYQINEAPLEVPVVVNEVLWGDLNIYPNVLSHNNINGMEDCIIHAFQGDQYANMYWFGKWYSGYI